MASFRELDVPVMLVALVGATGWLGQAVHAQLLADGSQVRTLGRHDLDQATPAELRLLLRPGPDLVVVNAGGRLRGTDEQLVQDNLALPLILVEALDGTGAHLVHLGSPAEYGDPGGPELIPETHPCNPTSTYGRTKAEASQAVLAHDDWCVLRPFNVIDLDMVAANPIAIIRERVRRVAQAGRVVELDAAEAMRDHVSRAFVATSVALAAKRRISGAFNLCSGVGLTYRTITQAIATREGVEIGIADLDRPGIRAVVGDPTKWAEQTGRSEAMDAHGVAELVCS